MSVKLDVEKALSRLSDKTIKQIQSVAGVSEKWVEEWASLTLESGDVDPVIDAMLIIHNTARYLKRTVERETS